MHKFRSTTIHPIGSEIISTQCFFITQILQECQIIRVLTILFQILIDIITQPSWSFIVIDVVILTRTEQGQAHCSAKTNIQVINLMFSHISLLLNCVFITHSFYSHP